MSDIKEIVTDAVVQDADFGPAYDGETYITVTFRVPENTRILAGIWELRSVSVGRPEWSKSQEERKK
jgi:predicted lysophospholipase L1 biosynthesis ABC-type transport system permease subunit